MPTLPVPVFSALILGWMGYMALRRRDRHPIFAVLILACAVQGLITALGQHYGIVAARLLQPVTASAIPPLAYSTLLISSGRSTVRDAVWHGLVVPFTLFALIVAPETLDVILPVLFLTYAGAIHLALRRGDAALPGVALDKGDQPLRFWHFLALALALSAVSDVLIYAAQVAGFATAKGWIIAVFSSTSLLALGLLSQSEPFAGENAPTGSEPEPAETAADAEIMARLEELVRDRQMYLDPALTLAQLARRLHLPVKTLSGAINRSRGENVSRYINQFRIAHACGLLKAGESVTGTIYASGFNTKSNFNREFLRITGMAPGAWLASETAPPVIRRLTTSGSS